MAGVRELVAIALGALLGLAAIAYPEALLRIQTAGTRPDRRNDYGEGGTVSDRAVLVVRLLGVAVLGVAAVIALQSL
jgi:hypothetical protein